MTRLIAVLSTGLLTGLLPLAASASPSAYALSGGGGDRTTVLRASAIWHWDKRWFEAGDWHLTGYWEANAAVWNGHGDGGETLVEAGASPVFRLRPNASGAFQPYWEFGVGATLISRTHIDDTRAFGSHFQFTEHVGFGVTFGEKTRYDVAYRLQHVSNAGIKEPNDGIDFHQIRLTYLY